MVALEDRVAALEALIGGGVSAVLVDCVTDTIADALDLAAAGTPITITVQGLCEEDVFIDKDDVTLKGATGPATDEIVGGITIDGAQRVTVQDLTIRDGTTTPDPSFPVGVFLTDLASATLQNLDVFGHGGAGIWARRNAFVLLDTVDVSIPAGGEEAVLLADGADARIQDSTIVSNNPAAFFGAALGLFRSAHARLDGGNTIQNTTADPDPAKAIAITVADTSNLRIQRSGNTVEGNVQVETNSQGDFRGVTFVGQTLISGQSSVTYSQDPSITGNILLQQQAMLQAFGAAGDVDVSGTVTCTDTQSGIVDFALSAGGGVIGCTVLP